MLPAGTLVPTLRGVRVLDLEAAVSGVFTGGSYALIGVAITLMFRSTGVLSFAHAAFAAVAAFVYVDFGDRGWPLPLAAAVAVLAATVYGLLVERLAVRPLVGASPATRLIATLGILTFTSGLLLWHYGFAPVVAEPLLPTRSVTVLDVAVSYQKVAVLATAAVLAALLAGFLDRTRFGTAVRAVAQDPEAARLHGISLGAVARFNWGLGACLSAIVGVLVAPLQIVNVGTFTLLLTKSLAGTLVGGMASLPLTFLGGLLVGVIEAIASVRFDQPGMRELSVLGLVVVVLLVRRTWAVAPTAYTEPRTRRRIRIPVPAAVRPLVFALAGVGAVVALVVPAGSTYWSFVGGRTLFFVIQALSLVMLVGWGGQVSLMQGAYVGVGALGTGYLVVEHELALWLALLLSAVAGTAMGAIAGIPALRLSGLQFAVASLAFTGAAAAWLFERPEIPSSLARSDLFGIDLASDTSIYYVMLPLTGLLMLAAANLRRSVQGRFLIAARDAPEAVEHFGASATRARMGVFLVAAFTATLGGGLYAVLISGLSPTDFAPMLSLSLLVYTVVGGSQSLVGPVMAGLAFGLLPQITQSTAGGSANAVPDIIAGATVILVLVFRPGGLADLVPRPRLAPAVPTASTVDVAAAVRERLRDVAPPTASATLAAARSHLHQPTNPGEPRARGAFRAPVA